jgi:hypothetical protein
MDVVFFLQTLQTATAGGFASQEDSNPTLLNERPTAVPGLDFGQRRHVQRQIRKVIIEGLLSVLGFACRTY